MLQERTHNTLILHEEVLRVSAQKNRLNETFLLNSPHLHKLFYLTLLHDVSGGLDVNAVMRRLI